MFIYSAIKNIIVLQIVEDLVRVHTKLHLLFRKKFAYKDGSTYMWDVGDN